MRKLRSGSVLCFAAIMTGEVAFSVWFGFGVVAPHVIETYRSLAALASTLAVLILSAVCVFRLIQHVFPLRPGIIPEGSIQEFKAHLLIMQYLMLLNPLIFSTVIPVPFMRIILRMLGTKMGANSYSAGVLTDPPFTAIGRDTIIGKDAIIIAHVLEGRKFEIHPVVIGDRVTIGAKSVLMPGVVIGDDATVAVGAVVLKGTVVGDGELWGGVPARLLRPSCVDRSTRK